MNAIVKCVLMATTLAVAANAPSVHAADNPMEYVGVEHNRYLDCLLKSRPSRNDSLFEPLVERCGYPGDPRALEAEYGMLIGALRDGIGAYELLATYRGLFTDGEFAFLLRIQWALQDTDDADLIQTRLGRIQDDALQAVDTTTSGGRAVLAGLAVARHSAEYWSAHGGALPAGRKWWEIVAADMVGAVLGSVLPGAGTVGLSACFSGAVALSDE